MLLFLDCLFSWQDADDVTWKTCFFLRYDPKIHSPCWIQPFFLVGPLRWTRCQRCWERSAEGAEGQVKGDLDESWGYPVHQHKSWEQLQEVQNYKEDFSAISINKLFKKGVLQTSTVCTTSVDMAKRKTHITINQVVLMVSTVLGVAIVCI